MERRELRVDASNEYYDLDEFVPQQADAARSGLSMSDEVGAAELLQVVRRDIAKARAYRMLPCYLIFLVVVTLIPWMSRLSNSRYNELYHLEKANTQELLLADFMGIESVDAFWVWYRKVVNQTYLMGGNGKRLAQLSNIPVGFLLVRQFRVESTACWRPSVISGNLRAQIPDACYGEWEDATMSTRPFGVNGEWRPGSSITVLAVSTMFHTYSGTDDAFTISLPVSQPRDVSFAEIDNLQANNWVDQATRVVIIDILTFNPSIDAFALNHFFIEFFATGSVVAGSKAYPFDLLHFDSHARRFLFLCDIFHIVGTVFLFGGLLAGMYMRWEQGRPFWQLGPFEVFDIFFIIFLVNTSYYRMLLWQNGPALHDGDPPTSDEVMFSELFTYGFSFERANTYVGIIVVFAWLRLFKFIQYNSKLGVLTETVKQAAGDLVAMFCIFFIVLVGYGIGGSALYGVDHKSFSSWWLAMSYLLRLLISAEIDAHYDELKVIHPDWTGFYVATFMVITWVILLNMVLAIITGAFVSVHEGIKVEKASVTIDGVKKDFYNLLIRIRPCFHPNSQKGYCQARVAVVKWLNATIKTKRAANKSQEVFVRLDEFIAGTSTAITAQQGMRMFQRTKLKERQDKHHMKIGQKFAANLSEQMELLKESMQTVNNQLEKMQGTAASDPDAAARPSPLMLPKKEPSTRRSSNAKLAPAPDSPSREKKMERRRKREDEFRTSAAAVLDPAFGASAWRDEYDASKELMPRLCSVSGCGRPNDTDAHGILQDYCDEHLCHGCFGTKLASQVVCHSCDADFVGDGVPAPPPPLSRGNTARPTGKMPQPLKRSLSHSRVSQYPVLPDSPSMRASSLAPKARQTSQPHYPWPQRATTDGSLDKFAE